MGIVFCMGELFDGVVLQRIASHLDAKSFVRFSCVSKRTREVLSDLPVEHIDVNVSNTWESLGTFASFLVKHRSTLKTLAITTDIDRWGCVWRFVRSKIAPNLQQVTLMHSTFNALVLINPEDFFPTSEVLDSLCVTSAADMHLGGGLSRLSLRHVAISCYGILHTDALGWLMSSLENVSLRAITPYTINFAGLMQSTLCHLEAPADFAWTVVPHLAHLRSLWLHGESAREDPPGKMSSTSLQSIRLAHGSWRTLEWAPKSVTKLECLGCKALGSIKHLTRLQEVLIYASRVTPACDLDSLMLQTFMFDSAGQFFEPFTVHSRHTFIAAYDLHKVVATPVK